MRLLIDGDPIVYRVGFASEYRQYGAVAQDAVGALHEGFFEPGDGKTANAKLLHWLDENDLELVDKWPVVIAQPVNYALHSTRLQVESIIAEVAKYVGVDSHSLEVSVALTGPGNYRESLATVRPYKGNRDPEHKPVHYQPIRDYLVSEFGAAVVHGREADDEVSILARRTPSVVATIDKDLDQVPGLHYDYAKKVFYDVSAVDAERFFWIQVLAGDGTDNIPGVKGIGMKKAAKYVDQWYEKSVSDHDKWELTCAYYNLQYGYPKGIPIALETARLVYMQHEPNELWVPPGEPKQYLAGEVE